MTDPRSLSLGVHEVSWLWSQHSVVKCHLGKGERIRRQAKTELGSWYNAGSFGLMKQTGGSIAWVIGGHWVGRGVVVAGWSGGPYVHIVKGLCVGPCVARLLGEDKSHKPPLPRQA